MRVARWGSCLGDTWIVVWRPWLGERERQFWGREEKVVGGQQGLDQDPPGQGQCQEPEPGEP